MGGKIISKGRGEYGVASVNFNNNEILFDKMSSNSKVWMSHGDEVGVIGDEWTEIAKSDNGVIAAIKIFKIHILVFNFIQRLFIQLKDLN